MNGPVSKRYRVEGKGMAVQMSKGWLNIDHKLQGKQEIKE